jgi:hypothetical protein
MNCVLLETTKHTVSGNFDEFRSGRGQRRSVQRHFRNRRTRRLAPGLAAKAVYLTLNPASRDTFARSANKVTHYAHTIADSEITSRHWLLNRRESKGPAGSPRTWKQRQIFMRPAEVSGAQDFTIETFQGFSVAKSPRSNSQGSRGSPVAGSMNKSRRRCKLGEASSDE